MDQMGFGYDEMEKSGVSSPGDRSQMRLSIQRALSR